jgi:hypothetical protein
MPTKAHNQDAMDLVRHSMLYKELLAKRDELTITKPKYLRFRKSEDKMD